jgi:large subunit ribosomal protein L25
MVPTTYRKEVYMYELLTTDGRETGRNWKPSALRKEGWVPGVIYGKGTEPVHFKVPAMKLKKFLHHSGKVFEVEVTGYGKHLVNVQDIQWDHFGDTMIHVAFHKLQANQKTKVTVPIHWVGEAPGHKAGGVVNHAYNEIELYGLPKDIPEYYEVNVDTLEMNANFHLDELTPPAGCTFTDKDNPVIVSCHPPKKVEETKEEVTPEVIGEAPTASDEEKSAA